MLRDDGTSVPRCVFSRYASVKRRVLIGRAPQIGLVHLGSRLRVHPVLMTRYLDVLMSLPQSDREALVGMPMTTRDQPAASLLTIPCSTGVAFVLDPVSVGWDSLGVAQALVQQVKDARLERLELSHVQCLRGTTDVGGNGPASLQEFPAEWAGVFRGASDYLFVALCDRECCQHAIEVIRFFAMAPSLSEEVVRSPMLVARWVWTQGHA